MVQVKNYDYQIFLFLIWLFFGVVSVFVMLVGVVVWMKGMIFFGVLIEGLWMFLIGFVVVLYVMFGWWVDVVCEGEFGEYILVVCIGL